MWNVLRVDADTKVYIMHPYWWSGTCGCGKFGRGRFISATTHMCRIRRLKCGCNACVCVYACVVCTCACVCVEGVYVSLCMCAASACRGPGSNRGPSDLQSDALPVEVSRLDINDSKTKPVSCLILFYLFWHGSISAGTGGSSANLLRVLASQGERLDTYWSHG